MCIEVMDNKPLILFAHCKNLVAISKRRKHKPRLWKVTSVSKLCFAYLINSTAPIRFSYLNAHVVNKIINVVATASKLEFDNLPEIQFLYHIIFYIKKCCLLFFHLLFLFDWIFSLSSSLSLFLSSLSP